MLYAGVLLGFTPSIEVEMNVVMAGSAMAGQGAPWCGSLELLASLHHASLANRISCNLVDASELQSGSPKPQAIVYSASRSSWLPCCLLARLYSVKSTPNFISLSSRLYDVLNLFYVNNVQEACLVELRCHGVHSWAASRSSAGNAAASNCERASNWKAALHVALQVAVPGS